MEIVDVILKDNMYIVKSTDVAINFEKQIAIFSEPKEYEYAFSAGCNKMYNETSTYKAIYPEKSYNDVWTYIKAQNGTIRLIEDNFDEIMKDENLQGALGAVRLNRITYTVKRVTNGKDCNDCVC